MNVTKSATVVLFTTVLASAQQTASFDVRAFGAKGDGRTLDTDAIDKAIDATAASGTSRSPTACSKTSVWVAVASRIRVADRRPMRRFEKESF